MRFEIVEPTFEFSWQTIVDLLTKALKVIFGFIADEEGWNDAE